MLPEVKDYIENYKLLKSKFKRMEEISEEIIKIKIKNYREELKKNKQIKGKRLKMGETKNIIILTKKVRKVSSNLKIFVLGHAPSFVNIFI